MKSELVTLVRDETLSDEERSALVNFWLCEQAAQHFILPKMPIMFFSLILIAGAIVMMFTPSLSEYRSLLVVQLLVGATIQICFYYGGKDQKEYRRFYRGRVSELGLEDKMRRIENSFH